jgi:hypothetical protein
MGANMKHMNDKRLRIQAIGLLIGYALQFLAGMTLNLFVKVPDQHPGVNASNYFGGILRALGWTLSGGGGWPMAFHVYLALALTLGSLGLCVASIRMRLKVWVISSIIAALSTIGALFNGLSFVNYNHDFSSLIMASCWLAAVGSIGFALMRRRPVAQRY